jgi:hypothetical protein
MSEDLHVSQSLSLQLGVPTAHEGFNWFVVIRNNLFYDAFGLTAVRPKPVP